MNNKCPKCGNKISLLWLYLKSSKVNYVCQKCNRLIGMTSKRVIINAISGGIGGGGGVIVGMVLNWKYDSFVIAITGIVIYVLCIHISFPLFAPGLIRVVSSERRKQGN